MCKFNASLMGKYSTKKIWHISYKCYSHYDLLLAFQPKKTHKHQTSCSYSLSIRWNNLPSRRELSRTHQTPSCHSHSVRPNFATSSKHTFRFLSFLKLLSYRGLNTSISSLITSVYCLTRRGIHRVTSISRFYRCHIHFIFS